MKAMVRQVRLCVEVLRRQVAGQALTPEAAKRLDTAEAAYRMAAYTAVLGQVGTSYDELRLIRDADPASRAKLAERLGISLGATRPDRLDALLLDEATVSEADLERLFGLVSTRTSRDPLSDGLVLGDPQGQVTRWDLRGIEWRRNTDAEGLIHARIRRSADGIVHVELYRDEARTDLVASGEDSGGPGRIALAAHRDSGLTGHVSVVYQADTATVALAAVPRLLAWRLDRLRATWEAQDRPAEAGTPPRPPIIDPDLVGAADLRDLLTGAATLWETRGTEAGQLFVDLRAARLAAAAPADALDATLLFPQTLGKTAADLLALDATRQGGTDIRATLAALELSEPAFNVLVRVARLVSTKPPSAVLDSEWLEVDAIMARVCKSRHADAWRAEEAAAGITLGPDFFIVPGPPEITFPPQPAAPPATSVTAVADATSAAAAAASAWLTSDAERLEWQQTLQARTDQRLSLVGGMREAVLAAEEATIAGLRDALLVACAPGDVAAAAASLTDSLLIDCADGTCQLTTRIAQAIETIQVLLLSVRTGQLRGFHPTVTLAAPDFEDEWKWLGSYATWRPAMLVWMYPENVAHPALRDRQSPGFARLLRDSRALAQLTPDQACALAKDYSTYFRDICQLTPEASVRVLTRVFRGRGCRDRRPVQDRDVLHMFGRNDNTVYWATYDEAASPDPLSFWDWVPGLQQEKVLRVIGAAAYRLASGAQIPVPVREGHPAGHPGAARHPLRPHRRCLGDRQRHAGPAQARPGLRRGADRPGGRGAAGAGRAAPAGRRRRLGGLPSRAEPGRQRLGRGGLVPPVLQPLVSNRDAHDDARH